MTVRWAFETRQVHAGTAPDPTTRVLSIGIEHLDDILADLDRGFAAVHAT